MNTIKALISPRGAYQIWGPLEGEGGLIRDGALLNRGAYLKFFDSQRQNCNMSMEFEMLRSFNNKSSMNYCVT